MLYEILRDSPAYREVTRRNIEEGRLQEAKKAFKLVAQVRFSNLSSLINELADFLHNVDVINELLIKISVMQDVHEAELLLLQELKKYNK